MLWNKSQEMDFFKNSLKLAAPEQLFYVSNDGKYLAYWPKGYKGKKTTLQSRNAFIGNFTEKWCAELLGSFASKIGFYVVQDVICDEIGLSKLSPADAAICKTKDAIQKAENIALILEVKMSITWNWELRRHKRGNELICLGDFNSHQGNPSLLRSDTMLKAIGKSINVRVSSYKASKIPIIILGNTPISKSYYDKVDHLKKSGITQGFWSLNANPLDDKETLKSTANFGFHRFDKYEEFEGELNRLLKEEREFFSSMQTKKELGEIIEIADKEFTYEKKAEKFLKLIRK